MLEVRRPPSPTPAATALAGRRAEAMDRPAPSFAPGTVAGRVLWVHRARVYWAEVFGFHGTKHGGPELIVSAIIGLGIVLGAEVGPAGLDATGIR